MATKRTKSSGSKAATPKTKATRKPSKAALFQALGEAAFALFEAGDLPVPRKLAAAVDALRSPK